MCKVLIADDSEVMRKAIRATLVEERGIEVVGEAATFNEAVQKLCDLKPDILLLDLHLPEKRGLVPEIVKSQLGRVCTLAVSFTADHEASDLAKSYGAAVLLDKMSLYSEMIPAIKKCQPDRDFSAGRRALKSRPQVA
jgi:DNA-binding NarL/FixJ family response regulator